MMGFSLRNRPSRLSSWLIIAAMTCTIASQALLILADANPRWVSWALIALSTVILGYAVVQLLRKPPRDKPAGDAGQPPAQR